MTYKNIIPKLLLIIVIVLCVTSCTKINPCGVFAFTGNAATGGSTGIDMNVNFDFDPGACGSTCNTSTICYIQMVRTYNLEEGTYSYISEEHEARGTEYGWYVDRVTGKDWGYYGRNDDGSFASYLTPGNNTNDAILNDAPRRPGSRNIWWQAVSASVSIDGGAGSCNNNFLGYYFWSWVVDDAGLVTNDYIVHGVAWEDLQTIMDDAVAAWNTQAPGLGHNVFPTFNKLMY